MIRKISKLTSLGRSLVAASALLVAALPADASVIGSYVINGDGTVTYSYEVNNSAGTFDISAWALDFGFAIPDWDQIDSLSGGDVEVPNADWSAGAGIPLSGQSAQDFLALNPSGDVLIGQTLTGFSFTSSFLPGTVTFHEFSATGSSVSGTTIGPVNAVPDAGKGVEGIAVAALAAFATSRRMRRSH